MEWESYAIWDKSQVQLGNTLNESTDSHRTYEEAEGVVILLRREGFGGEKKFFPIEAGVREKK